jgi:macrolide transport system ATP-binding/permease protein
MFTPSPMSTVSPLRVDGLSVQIAGTRVLTDVSFTVSPGHRVGLIGENGSGKSTVLHAIHGSLPVGATTAGTVDVGQSRVGLLHQQAPFRDDESVHDALETAVAAERQAAVDLELAADPYDAEAYTAALDVAERLDVWETDARISATLAGLGLAAVPQERRTGELSGGQRARLSLAWLLLNRPDILLLDEPTNHLDDAATQYLAGVLNTWKGAVLFASHDRAFLDRAASSLIDLDPAPSQVGVTGGVTRYTGNYTDYLAARQDVRARWERQYRDEQAELKRLRAGVRDNHQVGHVGASRRARRARMAAEVLRRPECEGCVTTGQRFSFATGEAGGVAGPQTTGGADLHRAHGGGSQGHRGADRARSRCVGGECRRSAGTDVPDCQR